MRRLYAPSLLPASLLVLLSACAARPPQGTTPYEPSAAMRSVLLERQAMHATHLSGLDPHAARDTPSLIDAARAIPNVHGLPATTTEVPQATQLTASGADGALGARLYRPTLARDTPVILYFPGGTWVTGTLDQYEESARQLAARTGYVVVMMRPRLAPEAPFPAIHDDAFALYQWARAHLREWGADPTRVALAGEGPGANLALSVALQARDRQRTPSPVPTPDALLLITPVAGTALDTASMAENRRAEPLSRADVSWAQDLYAPDDLRNPRIDLAARTDFTGMPPTTVILAPIDPLRSGAEDLAARMSGSGVPVQTRLFPGTTYGFFGLGSQVPEAAAAEDYAATRLKAQFYRADLPALPGRSAPARRARARR